MKYKKTEHLEEIITYLLHFLLMPLENMLISLSNKPPLGVQVFIKRKKDDDIEDGIVSIMLPILSMD